MSRDQGAPTEPRTLAERLNWLFEHIRPEGKDREYTGREVIAGIQARGTEISASHLSELRRGMKTNPTMRVLQGLAEFFEVKVAYFFDDDLAPEVEAEVRLRAAMRDAHVRELAFRVAGLAPDQRTAMYRLLTEVVSESGEANDTGDTGRSRPPDSTP